MNFRGIEVQLGKRMRWNTFGLAFLILMLLFVAIQQKMLRLAQASAATSPTSQAAKPRSIKKPVAAKNFAAVLGHVKKRDKNGKPIAYLTFDDGPSPQGTPQLLRILDTHNAKATFFVLGLHAKRYPHLLQAVAARGHHIANHTYDHQIMPNLSGKRIDWEINATETTIRQLVPGVNGYNDMFILRAPYGMKNRAVIRRAAKLGYRVAGWNVDPEDWRNPGVEAIVANVMRNTKPGSIILSHDGGTDRAQTIAAYKRIIPRLKKKGYVFWTLEQGLAR